MPADVDIATVAALFGERARAAMLSALADGGALSAADLARAAGIRPPTASAHLAKLTAGGVVTSERNGRHRFYRIRDERVAAALEALAVIAPPLPATSFRTASAGAAIEQARTCYDHLAGKAGVSLLDGLLRRRLLAPSDSGAVVTARGERAFTRFGVDVDALRRQRRTLVRLCLDWSEQRNHLAGALGAAVTARMLELGWLERTSRGRAVKVTDTGTEALRDEFAVREASWRVAHRD